jgi:hypothetical protein
VLVLRVDGELQIIISVSCSVCVRVVEPSKKAENVLRVVGSLLLSVSLDVDWFTGVPCVDDYAPLLLPIWPGGSFSLRYCCPCVS